VAWLITYLRDRPVLRGSRCAVVLPTVVACLPEALEALDTVASEVGLVVRPFLRVEDAVRWLGVE
jgi:hypothetical protein